MEERQRGVNGKMKKIKILLVILVLCAAGAIYYKLNIAGKETTDDARFDSFIVPISAKVSGYVKALSIKDNQMVHAGDPLLEIDPVDYLIAVDKSQATLEAAEAQYQQATENLEATKVSAPSSVTAAQAAVAAAQADLDNATKDAARNRKLWPDVK